MGLFIEKEPIGNENRYYITHKTKGKEPRVFDILYIDEDRKIVVLQDWAAGQGWRMVGEICEAINAVDEPLEGVPPPYDADLGARVLSAVEAGKRVRFDELPSALGARVSDLRRAVDGLLSEGRIAKKHVGKHTYLVPPREKDGSKRPARARGGRRP